jgi:hypothetical protein
MDFMERMDIGRAERKRTLERMGGTTCSVVMTAEYYRRRGAGHDDRADVTYWEPEETMTDDDWNALAGEGVADAVDAAPAGQLGCEKDRAAKPAKSPKPKAAPRANFSLSRGQIMTAKQYIAALKKLELSPYGAAPVLGISPRMSLRYSAGTHPIPETVAKLVRAMATLKASGHDIDV